MKNHRIPWYENPNGIAPFIPGLLLLFVFMAVGFLGPRPPPQQSVPKQPCCECCK